MTDIDRYNQGSKLKTDQSKRLPRFAVAMQRNKGKKAAELMTS